ncbi:threonine--tRNA ligase [Candidatus Woesearchaeota archaeon]|nr:threonine--tRNA ligase [Candidatus Woesearchaeota archaeon]
MKILAIHADYLKFKPTKKALKNAEEVDEKEVEVKECLVLMTSVEKKDEAHEKEITERLVAEAKDIAEQLKAKNLVIYPYAHLSSELANPTIAVHILDDAKKLLIQEGYTVIRAPFGWYKSFEWRCKGHPLSELSRSIDLSQPGAVIKKDAALKPKALELDLQHNTSLQNTGSFILAWAVHELFPKAIPILALSQKDAFTVDFANVKFTHTDLQKIGKKMDDFVKKNYAIKEGIVKAEHPFQNELLQAYKKEVKAFSYGSFNLLLPGSVLLTTGGVKAFSLENISGSYWKNDSNNVMLQRILGHAFKSEQELKDFLEKLATAQERDHRRIGKELQLFQFDELSPGSPIFLPKGTIIYNELLQLLREQYRKRGYQEVITPQMFNKTLWETSGHWQHYKENMFVLNVDNTEFALKPMNCPSHLALYNSTSHSYRDLPLRLADFCFLHRNEVRGTLGGMTRVRKFAQDDGHIFVTMEQVEEEMNRVLDFVNYIYNEIFKLPFSLELSTRPESAMGDKELWDKAESLLKRVLENSKIPYKISVGEGAFYGPKIDIHIKDALGRSHQCATLQLDFQLPKRFNAVYEGSDGKKHPVVMIHRAMLGSMERFIGVMTEHYAGKFPLWLSPVQVKLITVTDDHISFAKEVYDKLFAAGIRVELNDKPETLPKKVRDAELERVNYIVTIGDKEVEKKTLAVRSRGGKVQFGVQVDAFVKDLQEKISQRILDA